MCILIFIRYSTVQYGTVRYGTVRYGTVQYGTSSSYTVQYGKVQVLIESLRKSRPVFLLMDKVTEWGYIGAI